MTKTIRRIEAQIPITTKKKRVAAYARVSLIPNGWRIPFQHKSVITARLSREIPVGNMREFSQTTASAARAQTERNSSA